MKDFFTNMTDLEEPVDYALEIMCLTTFLPWYFCMDIKQKWIRVLSIIAVFPYLHFCFIIPTIALMVCVILMLVQLFKDV